MNAASNKNGRVGTLIVDPTGGLSGDMFLGCLFALGVSPRGVKRAVSTLPGLEPFEIVVGRVKSRGISAFRTRVRCLAEADERDLRSILDMIERSPLQERVKDLASRTFVLLGEAEGKIHAVPVREVHFHEVGAVDSIVDIVGAAEALSMLGFPRIYHRPFRLGSGTISISHGELPVPAPATLELAGGRRVSLSSEEREIVTPTGAALMRTLADELPPAFSFIPRRVVYSAGMRETAAGPGILRVIEVDTVTPGRDVTVIRTTIDDMNPENYGFIQERLFEEGALEVYLTQVIMKKGRPGILLTVLCDPSAERGIIDLLFRETTTLGVRITGEGREELERWTERVETPLGELEVKRGRLPDGTVKTAPEYESCRSLAVSRGIPIVRVYDMARSSVEPGGPRKVVRKEVRKGARGKTTKREGDRGRSGRRGKRT